MFCGKKEKQFTVGTKVASDDPAELNMTLHPFIYVIDKNFGLQVKSKQNLNKVPQKDLLDKKKLESKELALKKVDKENELKETQLKKQNVEKKVLVKQLKYEKLKAKLLSVLKEYEIKSNKLAEIA